MSPRGPPGPGTLQVMQRRRENTCVSEVRSRWVPRGAPGWLHPGSPVPGSGLPSTDVRRPIQVTQSLMGTKKRRDLNETVLRAVRVSEERGSRGPVGSVGGAPLQRRGRGRRSAPARRQRGRGSAGRGQSLRHGWRRRSASGGTVLLERRNPGSCVQGLCFVISMFTLILAMSLKALP